MELHYKNSVKWLYLAVIILAMISLTACSDEEQIISDWTPYYTFNVTQESIDEIPVDETSSISCNCLDAEEKALDLSADAHKLTFKTSMLAKLSKNGEVELLTPERIKEESEKMYGTEIDYAPEAVRTLVDYYLNASIENVVVQDKSKICGDFGNSYEVITLNKVGENIFAGRDFSVEKFVKDGYLYFSVTIPENREDFTKRITLYIKGGNIINNNGDSSANFGDVCIDYNTTVTIDQEAAPVIKVRYKKQTYISEYSEDEDGNVLYKDEATRNLLEQLGNMENIETIVADGIVYFLDDEDVKNSNTLKAIACSSRNMPQSSLAPKTRATSDNVFKYVSSTSLGYAILFDDKNYSDSYIYNNLIEKPENTTNTIISMLEQGYYSEWLEKDLEQRGINDKISSLAVGYYGNQTDVCCVLTVWEDNTYNIEDHDRTKHRMSFIATYDNKQVGWSNLSNIPCIGSSKSWNDRISSLSLHFGYKDFNMKNY